MDILELDIYIYIYIYNNAYLEYMHAYLLTYCTYLQYSCCWGLRVEIIVVVGILLKPNLDPATLLEKKKKKKKKKRKPLRCVYVQEEPRPE